MSFTFFATKSDLRALAWRVLADPDLTVVEAWSRPDRPNRWFETADDLAGLPVEDFDGFHIWARSTGARPQARRATFNEETRKALGGTGRTVLESPAVIGIARNQDQMGCLASSQMTYWTEKGARERSAAPVDTLDGVDWTALKAVTGRIQRAIKAMGPARFKTYPILPDAWSRVRSGEQALWAWGERVEYGSADIREVEIGRGRS